MQTFQALGAPSPCLRRLGALPPKPQPAAVGGLAPRPPLASGGWGLRPQTPKTAPQCEFLATRLPEHWGIIEKQYRPYLVVDYQFFFYHSISQEEAL